jgi:hypothetical protein
VEDLATQWDAWAKRAKVYPKASNRKKSKKGKAAVERTGVDDPPQVAGRAFSVTADIQASKPNGVVLSHGGVNFGYSLNFVQGQAVFELRNAGTLTRLVATEATGGACTVGASLTEKEMTISIDGEVIARRASPGLLKGQPVIGFFVGEDFKDPVGRYAVPNRFNGRVLAMDARSRPGPKSETYHSLMLRSDSRFETGVGL